MSSVMIIIPCVYPSDIHYERHGVYATQLGAMLMLQITQDKGAPWLRSVWHSEQGSVAVPQGPAGGGLQAATERSLRE